MAGLARLRPASGIKRKLSATNDTLFTDGDERIVKRISPFHNTPIQKKETKRRILKISMRKMRAIDCPETFLRRSVLINNLARSLQDDLRDDKIWGRWDWAGEMEILPCRSPSPHRVQSRDNHVSDTRTSASSCTLLTNTCSAPPLPSPSANQWTYGAQAHWLSDEDDAHMSPSERERVTRDLTQSHDRLAETVESLTSFDNDFPSSDKDVNIKDTPLVSSNGCRHPDKDIARMNIACNCGNNQQHPVTGNHIVNYDSGFCLAKRDINKNQVFPCTGSTAKSQTMSPIDTHHLEHYTPPGYISPLDTPMSQPIHCATLTSKGHDEDSRYSDFHFEKLQCFDKVLDKEPWSLSCSNLDYSDESGATYLDMTSNSVCRVTTESSLLDSLDSCNPCLQTAVHSISVPIDSSAPMTESNPLAITLQPSTAMTNDSNCKCNFTTTNNVSPVDVTTPISLWNSSTYQDPNNQLVASPCPSPGHTGSCSSEADRTECVTPLQYADQDKFTSQSLRDFDIIYNNLVSVLIGGN